VDLLVQLWLVLAARKFLGGMEHGSGNYKSAQAVQFSQTASPARTNPGREPQHLVGFSGHSPESDPAPRRFRRVRDSARQRPQFGQGFATGRRLLGGTGRRSVAVKWPSAGVATFAVANLKPPEWPSTAKHAGRWQPVSANECSVVALVSSQLSRLTSQVALAATIQAVYVGDGRSS